MENAKDTQPLRRGPSARAVLVAAGRSTRMQGAGGARKPLIRLDGRALLEITLAAFDASACVTSIVVVAHGDDLDAIRALGEAEPTRAAFRKVVAVVAGGAERVDSVRIGSTWRGEVDTNEAPFQVLCIHDAARPFVTPTEIDAVIRAAESGAALLAIPVRDTLKRSSDGSHVDATVNRAQLFAAQTPQTFEAERFLDCLERAAHDGFTPTDDTALWERYVGETSPVAIIPGSIRNTKITGPDDLDFARALLANRGTSA